MTTGHGPISGFIDRHFLHFNAAVLKDATDAYIRHIDSGGTMLLTMAGAMSTAEIGISLAEMIRAGKVHAICCTGANLEEDVFNLVAHSHYERVPHYRDLSPEDEQRLLDRHMNRVTDTCIPEHEAMRRIESIVLRNARVGDAVHVSIEQALFVLRAQVAVMRHALVVRVGDEVEDIFFQVGTRAADRMHFAGADHLRERDAELRRAHGPGHRQQHRAAAVDVPDVRVGRVFQNGGVEVQEMTIDEPGNGSVTGGHVDRF